MAASRTPDTSIVAGWVPAPVAATVAGFAWRRHLLGVLTLFFFALAIVSGLLLMAYYRPSVGAAHFSMGVIGDEVRLGWLARGVHAWSTNLLVLCGLLHLAQTYFGRRYQPAGRVVWVTGIMLLLVALAFAFTGSLLPWDQYAYWSAEGSRGRIAGVPVLGTVLLDLFWGGWEIGEEVLLRFYAFHVGLLPVVVFTLLALHLVFAVRRAGATAAPAPTRSASVAGLDLLVVGALATAVLLTLVVALPPSLAPPADPLTPLDVPARWYFRPARQVLGRLSGGAAILAVAGIVIVLLAVPFVDHGAVASRRGAVVRWALGIAVIAAIVALGGLP